MSDEPMGFFNQSGLTPIPERLTIDDLLKLREQMLQEVIKRHGIPRHFFESLPTVPGPPGLDSIIVDITE